MVSNIELLGDSYRVIRTPDLLPGDEPGTLAYTRVDAEQGIIWASKQIPKRYERRFISYARRAASKLIQVPILS